MDFSSGFPSADPLATLAALLQQARSHYDQLVLIVGGKWPARTRLMQAAASDFGFVYVPVGAALAPALLELPPEQRPLAAGDRLRLLTAGSDAGCALDHLEILFDPELKINPLRWLQSASSGRPVLAAWPGELQNAWLHYATPGHREYFRQPLDDVLAYRMEGDS